MKKRVLKSLIVMGMIMGMVGCGSSGSNDTYELPQDLKDSITFMYNEEGLAYDVYLSVYDELNTSKGVIVKPLKMIAENAEIKHIAAVKALAVKYDLNTTTYDPTIEPYEGLTRGQYTVPRIQELYDALYAYGTKSGKAALAMGCMVEVIDIDDLQGYMAQAEEAGALDVLKEFTFLITGSYTHYWSFDEALMKANQSTDPSDGCCSVTDSLGLGYDFCHPEFPKPKKEEGGHSH